MVSNFINDFKEKKDFFQFPSNMDFKSVCEDYYSAINIRGRQFNRTELYFMYLDENFCKAVIAISITPNVKVAYISTLFYLDDVKLEDIFICIEELLKSEGIQIIKVKFDLSENIKEKMFLKYNFFIEAALKNESVNGDDIIIMSKNI